VLPVHLNPEVRKIVREKCVFPNDPSRILQVEPLQYDQFAPLLKRAYLVLTDSGGIQEEVTAFSVPALVLRRDTERPEGVEAGLARLVGTERSAIVAEASRLLSSRDAYEAMAHGGFPYGDGHAAEKIVHLLTTTKSQSIRSQPFWTSFAPSCALCLPGHLSFRFLLRKSFPFLRLKWFFRALRSTEYFICCADLLPCVQSTNSRPPLRPAPITRPFQPI